MRRILSIAGVVGGAAAVIALCAPGASAADWQPYRTSPADYTGTCSFPVHAEAVTDEEETRIDAVLPDGSPRIQEFRGPLTMRFTNTSTGASVVRDLSGYGRLHFFADGGSTGYFDGGVSVHFPIGNRAYPAGLYVLHGRVRVRIAPDNDRSFGSLRHATIENLCTALG